MPEKAGALRRFLRNIPLVGPVARWVWRRLTAAERLVHIEQENEHIQDRLTQVLAQSAHAIRRTDEQLARMEMRLSDLAAESASPARRPGAAREDDSRAAASPAAWPIDRPRRPECPRAKPAEMDSRFKRPLLEVISELYAKQEPYQPLYGCPAMSPGPRRPCGDRAQAIERAMDTAVAGLRLLDLGASFGYFSLYFAERGARATGVDMKPECVTLARRVAEFNGLPAAFHTAEVSLDFVREISPTEFDAALVLSVLHHVTHARGLAETQTLMAELCARVPLVFVELALRREDVPFEWRASLPEDPAAVFARCEDVEITKIGEFPTHLSDIPRPLYRVRRKSVVVNGVRYAVDRATPFSYAGAEDLGKTFLFGPEVFAKRLQPREGPMAREILRQALREIANYENLRGRSARIPALKDYVVAPEEVILAFERLDAENLLDVLERGEEVDAAATLDGVVAALRDLRAHGLYHNDVRVWNVMVGASGVTLIDLGHAEPEETDDTRTALLWLAHDLGRGGVTRNLGWPVADAPSRTIEDYPNTVRPIVAKLLAAPSFDEFLKGWPS